MVEFAKNILGGVTFVCPVFVFLVICLYISSGPFRDYYILNYNSFYMFSWFLSKSKLSS